MGEKPEMLLKPEEPVGGNRFSLNYYGEGRKSSGDNETNVKLPGEIKEPLLLNNNQAQASNSRRSLHSILSKENAKQSINLSDDNFVEMEKDVLTKDDKRG